jgi:hypothetical protein
MSRWHARLAELRGSRTPPRSACSKCSNCSKDNFGPDERSEQIGQQTEPLNPVAILGSTEKGSHLIEYDGDPPRKWAEALAALDPNKPPGDVPQRRWLQFIDDCGQFLDDGWAEKAAALGWGAADLFGCDRHRPYARIDRTGLLWLMAGRRLVALTADSATIETAGGGWQTYRRAHNSPDQVLAWSLCGTIDDPAS